MAGQPYEVIFGGGGADTLTSAPNAGTAAGRFSLGNVQAHHSVIALVLIAVAVLFVLDKAGFRFAVTAGKR